MMKNLFIFLILFVVFSLLFFKIYFAPGDSHYYSKYIFTRSHVPDVRSNLSIWKITGSSEGSTEKGLTTLSVTEPKLEPCPDDPPDLVGPFKVKFTHEITVESVKKEVEPNLQNGGRYKPPNCISQHKVAVIIPFRNRYVHLKYWLYYLHPMLKRQQLDYGVYVINQDGDGVFNRAKLMNIGYNEALKEYDYNCFVFSDVDLIPMDDRNIYKCFNNPRHLSVAVDKFHFHLSTPKLFGGAISLSKEQFVKVNGFSNTFWGWGGEDDDMSNRVSNRGMELTRPDLSIGRYRMIKHERDLYNEANPEHLGKVVKTAETMDQDGLNSLHYKVTDFVKVKMYTFITVDVFAPKNKDAIE